MKKIKKIIFYSATGLIKTVSYNDIKNLKKGTFIKTGDIKRIRPGYGIKPKFEGEIYGKKLIKDVEIGDSVTWDKLEN